MEHNLDQRVGPLTKTNPKTREGKDLPIVFSDGHT